MRRDQFLADRVFLAYSTGISALLTGARKKEMSSYTGAVRRLSTDVRMSFYVWTSIFDVVFRQTFDVNVVDSSRTKHFLGRKGRYFSDKLIKYNIS